MKVLLKLRIAGKPIDAKVYYRKTVEIDNKLVELAKEKRGFKENVLRVVGDLAAFGMVIGATLEIKFTKNKTHY